jgi:hypothetical protein
MVQEEKTDFDHSLMGIARSGPCSHGGEPESMMRMEKEEVDMDVKGSMRVDQDADDDADDVLLALVERKEEKKKEEGEGEGKGDIESGTSSGLKETTISTSSPKEASSGSWKPQPWSTFQPNLRRGPFY